MAKAGNYIVFQLKSACETAIPITGKHEMVTPTNIALVFSSNP